MNSRFAPATLVLAVFVCCGPMSQLPDDQVMTNNPESPEARFEIDRHLGTDWYGIYWNGKKVGWAADMMQKITFNGRTAYRFSAKWELVIDFTGKEEVILTESCSTYYDTGELAELVKFEQEEGRKDKWHGIVNGDTMAITSSVDGVESRCDVSTPHVSIEDQIALRRLISSDPPPGASVQEQGYNIKKNQHTTTVHTIKGKQTILLHGRRQVVYEAVSSESDGSFISMLLDSTGRLLEMTPSSSQISLRREPKEIATNEDVRRSSRFVFPPKGELKLLHSKRLRVRITGMKDQDVLSEEVQQFEKEGDETWLVTLQQGVLPSKPLPRPIQEPELAEFLRHTGHYQCEHPDIAIRAKEIAGDEEDSVLVSHMICMWVFSHLEKNDGQEVDDALAALRSGAAYCKGHAALFVALCRAAGLPARGVGGLAYARSVGGFSGHAWAEVYVGKWVAVDPTLGQPIAGAARIKLPDEARIYPGGLSFELLEGDEGEASSRTEECSFTSSIGTNFVQVHPKKFLMGSRFEPEKLASLYGGKPEFHYNERPQHVVKIRMAFHMAVTEVSRGEFAQFVRATDYQTDAEKEGFAYVYEDGRWREQEGTSWKDPGFTQAESHPVVCVSWNDAVAFCEWLSAKDGKKYRLPTEAEWEYACRADSVTVYPWGDDPSGGAGMGNVLDLAAADSLWIDRTMCTEFPFRDGYAFTAPVGSFQENAWGLKDMIGNVWEWCQSRYMNYPYDENDGRELLILRKSVRVARGGSYLDYPINCRSASRLTLRTSDRNPLTGFRLCMDDL